MTLSDLFFLLRLDLNESYRFRSPRGKRTTKRGRRWTVFVPYALMLLIGMLLGFVAYQVAQLFGWSRLQPVLAENLDFGTVLFNAILLFSFIGSIMFSVSSVGNSEKMEYLMIMPIPLRTLFAEKLLLLIIKSSSFWLLIGTPIVVGFTLASHASLAFFSPIVYMILVVMLNAFGSAVGGLVGLAIARLVAGRRTLKQMGYFIFTSIAIIGSSLWYYWIYFSDDSFPIFAVVMDWAKALGLSSDLSPGHVLSIMVIGLLAGAGLSFFDFIYAGLLILLAAGFVYFNGIISEAAHYNGWLTRDSQRSSSRKIVISHEHWDPQFIPFLQLSPTLSVSIWHNIKTIRREGRVLAQYLIGPLRFVIFLLLPAFTTPESLRFLSPYFLIVALLPFAISYGVSFAGYETVYEGKNLMNLQLAAANFDEYVRGKVYSALPFSLAIGVILSIVVALIAPTMIVYTPFLILCTLFTTMLAGGIAADAAASGGNFKAERMFTTRRGSTISPPLSGGAMLKAQGAPYVISLPAIGSALVLGGLFTPLYSYLVLGVYGLFSYWIMRSQCHSAGVKLAQVEASKYM